MNRKELVESLKAIKEQAIKRHNDTEIVNVKIESFEWVIESAIQALSQEPICIGKVEFDEDKLREIVKEQVARIEITAEQELCTDAVSRDAVKQAINCWIGSGEYRYAMSERFLIDRINDLPSVNPQPCDDAISREDAEQMFRNIRSHLKPQDYKSAEEFNTRDLMLLNAEQMIHALPSVSTTKNIVNHGTMNITL